MQQLTTGTLLQGGKYKIEHVLGQGGFGITYLAEQPMLERKVCIKEFFFKAYCEREEYTNHVTLSSKTNQEIVERFRKKFLKEARVISKLLNDHIVQIHDIFEENSTAYYVMDYVDGESLGDMVKRVGCLDEQQALDYIKDVASALSYIHSKNINHLDIKPNNIMVRREDQRVLLIDFGVSKKYNEGTFEGTTTTPVGISHGYSPSEQYKQNGVQSFSPQSDVYALAATLYKLLTSQTPPEAIEVQDEGLPLAPLHSKQVSETTISAIVRAMKSKSQRTQSIAEFLADLSEPSEATVVVEDETKSEPRHETEPISVVDIEHKVESMPVNKTDISSAPNKEKGKSAKIISVVIALILVVVGIILYSGGKPTNAIIKVADCPVLAKDGSVLYKWTGELTTDSLPIGNGVAKYAANDKYGRKEYKGEMNAGKCESPKAVLTYSNGSKYEGSFKNGVRENGTLTLTNDEMYYKGTFKNDQEYNGKWYFLGSNELYSEIVNGKEIVKQ